MSSSSTSPPREHDVFVSFRGKDVRNTFIPYLFNWLEQDGFSYFYDEEPEDAGKKIEDKIFIAVRHARVALIVLSENYADSKWCLNELVEILRCNREHNNPVVIPVFYGVDPAAVNNLTSESKFGQAFERLCKKGGNYQQIEIWREALQEVKRFSGLEKSKFSKELDLLDAIVQSLCGRIWTHRSLNFAKTAIGADRLVDDVVHLLEIGKDDVRVIGISGIKGIGKTMVARAVCKGILQEFERFIFLDKVGEAESSNFVGLQMKLLQNLLKMNEQMPQDSSYGYTQSIKSNLRHKKILLILDGVTKKEQIKNLGVEDRAFFRRKSRILITTRDLDLLKGLNVDDTYNVKGLNRDEAFRLFCRCAFEREEPEEGLEELSRYLAHYAGGHPSALELWGSFLSNQSRGNWPKFSDKLVKNPDHINSIIPDFRRIFPEYPCKVAGLRGDDRRTKTWEDKEYTFPFFGRCNKGYTGVRKIDVGVDSEGIKFMTVQYDKKGRSQKTVTLGTKGGATTTRTIDLNYLEEYLTYMSGHTKEDSGRTILQSLTFHTNIRKHALIETDEERRNFSFPYTGHKIVGFHWSCNGSHLEFIEPIYKRIAHTPIGYTKGVLGPFGGAGENSWDSNDINGIFVRYADFISEITFKVHEATSSEPRTTYRGNGEENTFEVKLETPYEYITSFSGYFENAYDGRILIKSLTFRTNKRILGPIGREAGKHFSSPSKAVKVIGFFGRNYDYLETIGAHVEPYSKKLYPFKSVGLFGSSKESNWDDGNDHTNVRKILAEIEPGDGKFIRSIKFCYEKNGRCCPSKSRGAAQGKVVEPIEIDYSNEYLTSMSGYYTNDGITSLTFGTNKRMLELIGREEGMHFSSPAMGGKIVGFYGRSGEHLEAIGAYFEPISGLYPIKSIGPFGGSSGETWDHGKSKGVREIKVGHDINIYHITFVYDDGKDESYQVTYEGCAKGDYPKDNRVILDYPREYLTSISGYAEDGAIQSLTFYSNKGRYGPYGEETGKYFWYPSNGSKITGFYVTRDPDKETLKSIVVYVEPILRMYPFKTVGPFGGSNKTEWDDGVHTDVRGFRISFGKAIKGIRIAYDNNGSFVLGSEHGNEGNNNNEVLLDFPKERLLSISVWVDEGGKTCDPIIHDLKIFTTKAYYGPFIQDPWQKRNELTQFFIPSQSNEGRIVGFFGRVGRYLHSIGARLEPQSD